MKTNLEILQTLQSDLIEPDALRKEPSPACTHSVTQSGHGGWVCALCGTELKELYEYAERVWRARV